MKPAGFLCKIDKLGRIVIPKPLRSKYDLHTDDTIELFTDPDAIVIKKYAMSCIFCSGSDDLIDFKGKPVCRDCLTKLREA
ncbi:MAG: AbrB/MazE/SpoVT family DNA-binding domain-containing protein [Ruminococcus sp.]|nr:AbrB/MazE/SpoVT family DNA-binding domain-containing protein [Ruminococcus sp.]